ncbi:helix-turn-helix domain-containing protein [Aliikangiella maris]|uniref:Helix-turn-helix domain-containing protein n=2 Tax=Aliikangiella maris TaxID=3162458 RepID=A0ABV2BYP3_9GAMM
MSGVIKKYFFLLLINLFFALTQLSAEQFRYNLQPITTKHGLTQNTITDFIQDSEGYIWIASYNGLNRFDGEHIIQYLRHSEQFPIPENEVMDLELADDNRLWIFSRLNIFYRDPGQPFKEFVSIKSLQPENEIRNFTRIISLKNKLYVFNNKEAIELNYAGEVVKRIPYEGEERFTWYMMKSYKFADRLLLATTNGLRILNEDGTWQIKESWPKALKDGFQYTLVKVKQGFIIFSQFELFFLNTDLEVVDKTDYQSIGIHTAPFRASLNSDNTLWMATFDKVYTLKLTENIRTFAELKNAELAYDTQGNIYGLFIDQQDGVWIGTSNSGVRYLSRKAQHFKVLNYQRENSPDLPFSITSLAEDVNGKLFIGTSGGKIFYKSSPETTIQEIQLTEKNNNQPLGRTSELIAENDRLWIGTFNGLYRLSLTSGEFSRIKINPQQALTNVHAMIKIDRKIWGVSGAFGIFSMDVATNELTLMRDQQNWRPQWNHAIYHDIVKHKQHIYVTSSHGSLIKIDLLDGTIEELDLLKSQNQALHTIISNDNDTLWILSADELFEYNTVTQTLTPHFRAVDYQQTAFYALILRDNKLWIAGSTNILAYEISTGEVLSYSGEDGAIGEEYNSIGLVQKTGELLFSSTKGLLQISHSKALENLKTDNTIRVTNVEYYSAKDNRVNNFYQLSNDFQLHPDDTMTLSLAPVSIAMSGRIKVEYRLNEGEWLPVSNWEISLNHAQFKHSENLIELRSAYIFDDKFILALSIPVKAIHRFELAPAYYWFILASLLALLAVVGFKLRHLKKRFDSDVIALSDSRTQELRLQQSINQKIALAIEIQMTNFNQLLEPVLMQSDKPFEFHWQMTQLVQLAGDISNNQLRYVNAQASVDLKPLVAKLMTTHLSQFMMPDTKAFQIKNLNIISGKVSEVLIGHHFNIFQILLTLVAHQKLDVSLNKTSARRAELKFVVKFSKSDNQALLLMVDLCRTLAHLLVTCGRHLGMGSELIFSDMLFSWQITFPAAQRWRENVTADESQSTASVEYSWESNRRHHLQLNVVNLSSQTQSALRLANYYPVKVFTDIESFQADFEQSNENNAENGSTVASVDGKDGVTERLTNGALGLRTFKHEAIALDVVSTSRLLVVFVEAFNELLPQQLAGLAEQLGLTVIICSTDPEWFNAGIDQRFERVLLLPLALSSPVMPHIINFVDQLIKDNQPTETEQAIFDEATKPVEQPERVKTALIEKVISKSKAAPIMDLPTDSVLLGRLNEYLETYCADESLDVEKIAYSLHLSSRHLSRKLKKLLNMTTAEYVRHYRLTKALKLLRSGYPVNQVYKMTGFTSRNYFSTCFKKHFKVTPSEHQQIK